MPGTPLLTLASVIDTEFLRTAVALTRKDGAVGVDAQTANEYQATLGENLKSLLDRFKSGTYVAPPVRRVHIPKGDGSKTRPIGIPTYEDKVLQRAVAMVLETVYEQEFHDFSYGFRPRRSAHQALGRLREHLTSMRGGFVLEVDIKSFFDTLDHGHLRSFLDLRIRDGVLRRTIDKWLKAGVMEGGQIHHPEAGTPQGGVVSPLLANVYLHHVLDEWFIRDVKPRMRGEVHLVRYADDFVFVFQHESDARRVLDVLPKRFGKYGLTIHPDKTRLLPFRQPPYGWKARQDPPPNRGGFVPPDTFDFLGFTLHWGVTRRGGHAVFLKTANSRFRRAVKAIHLWLRAARHLPLAEQHLILCRKVRGHLAYYGLTGNGRKLAEYVHQVRRSWQKWLTRRSARRDMPWERFVRLIGRYTLPPPIVVHSVIRRGANPRR